MFVVEGDGDPLGIAFNLLLNELMDENVTPILLLSAVELSQQLPPFSAVEQAKVPDTTLWIRNHRLKKGLQVRKHALDCYGPKKINVVGQRQAKSGRTHESTELHIELGGRTFGAAKGDEFEASDVTLLLAGGVFENVKNLNNWAA